MQAPEWLWLWPAALLSLAILRLLVPRPPGLPLAAPLGDFGIAARRHWPLSHWLAPALLALAGLCLCLAQAQPSVRRQEADQSRGLDIMLCLDVSSSMTSTDLDGARTRLAVARQTAADFVARRPADRIGLVAFARYDDLLSPPSEDRRGLLQLLDGLEPVVADGPEDATGFGAALARAAETLGRGQGRARVAVLLTDGEENVAAAGEADAITPAEAAQLARALEVRVYAIAVGSGREIGLDGKSRQIDVRPLRATAEATGGVFFAAADAAALDGVYSAIEALEDRSGLESRAVLEARPWPWLQLAAALAMLGLLLARRGGGLWP